MKRAIRWLFAEPGLPRTPSRVISWWEIRRIPFNLIIGAYGLFCLLIFLWAITTSGHLKPGQDAVEPIALLAAPLGINALYTFGWLLEVPARRVVPTLSPTFAPFLLKAGLAIGLILITLPAAFWTSYRLAQLSGLTK
jgi:hypothetical protein